MEGEAGPFLTPEPWVLRPFGSDYDTYLPTVRPPHIANATVETSLGGFWLSRHLLVIRYCRNLTALRTPYIRLDIRKVWLKTSLHLWHFTNPGPRLRCGLTFYQDRISLDSLLLDCMILSIAAINLSSSNNILHTTRHIRAGLSRIPEWLQSSRPWIERSLLDWLCALWCIHTQRGLPKCTTKTPFGPSIRSQRPAIVMQHGLNQSVANAMMDYCSRELVQQEGSVDDPPRDS